MGTMGSPARSVDLAILGGGSAAFAAARRAHELGARVLMANEGPLGGTCVNVGCVPSKTLIRAAENHHQHATSRFRGLQAGAGRADLAELVREKAELVERLRRERYRDVLAALEGVELVEGRARLAGPGEIVVDGASHRADRILLATGARPARPPIPGLADPGVWDSASAMEAAVLPERLVVLGGRYVALELGQMFARLGSRVTLVQRSRRILPEEDADLADALTGYLEDEGIEVRTGHQVTGVRREGRDARTGREGAGFAVETTRDGATQLFHAHAVLSALGRAPNVEGLGLEAVGVERGPGGWIAVGEDLQTSVPGIYAAGDVIGEELYVYAAGYEGRLAAENALAHASTPRNYTALPWVIFTDPQVAGVGPGEGQAAGAGIEVEASTVPLSQVARGLAAHDTRGFVKLLRARGEDRLLGARILAPEGGEQILEPSLMIRFGLGISEVAGHFHPYLTQGEAVKLALLGFETDVATLSCCAQ